ncbi:MAG: hypothetical protein IK047_01760, partial [Clostridia bacterium]|nr:hypothetical protein [Clostridia bacterium]
REYEFVNEEEKAVLEQLRKAVVYYSEHPCVRKDTRGKKRLSELPDAEFLEALKANGLDRKDFPEDLKEEALAALKEEVEFYENHNIPEACGYMDFWNALYSAIHKYYGDEDTSI